MTEYMATNEEVIRKGKKVLAVKRKPIIYLSGPMAGRNWDDVEKKFKQYEALFTMLGFKVLNPCKFEHTDTNNRELTLMEDFGVLSNADYIFMLPGWREAKGCNAEWGYAIAMGITVLPKDKHLEKCIDNFMILTSEKIDYSDFLNDLIN